MTGDRTDTPALPADWEMIEGSGFCRHCTYGDHQVCIRLGWDRIGCKCQWHPSYTPAASAQMLVGKLRAAIEYAADQGEAHQWSLLAEHIAEQMSMRPEYAVMLDHASGRGYACVEVYQDLADAESMRDHVHRPAEGRPAWIAVRYVTPFERIDGSDTSG